MNSRRTNNRAQSIRTFRPDIEGLRAIAVLLVLLDHAGISWASGGYVGVDVFFVLSGFLITGLLIKEIETSGRISMAAFYARRARRLLPAGTLVLLVTVFASFLVLGENRATRVAIDAQWTALFASNFRFIQLGTDYLDAQLPPSPLQHYWSLAVEEQFYLVWPVLMFAVARLGGPRGVRVRLGVVLAGIIAGSLWWSVYQTAENGTAAYFSPFTRAHELAIGALLAVFVPRLSGLPRMVGELFSWAGIAIVLAVGFAFDATTVFPGWAVTIPVLGTALVVAGGTIAPERGAERVLRLSPFQWIGKCSYSLYLWHWPLLVIVPVWVGREFNAVENLLLCGVAIGFSFATYVFIENPVRGSTRLKERPALVSVGMGAVLVALSFAVAVMLSSTHRTSEETETVIASELSLPTTAAVLASVGDSVHLTEWPDQPKRIANPAYSKNCDVTRKATSSSACVHGDVNATRTMVVFGDSHAAMWIPALDVIGDRYGWRVIQLTKPGCQAPDFPRYSTTLRREYTECAEYREWALKKLEEIQPEIVVISNQLKDVEWMVDGKPTTDGAEDAWAAGLGKVIDRLSPVSGRIVVLGDMAYPTEPGIDCLTEHKNDIQKCGATRDEAVLATFNELERQTAEAHGAEYIDAIPWFCTATECPPVIGGLTVHRDALHIGENYAVWLSVALGSALGVL